MSAITKEGDKLLIIRGEYRGYVGEVREIKHGPCGLIDYLLIIDDSDEESFNEIPVIIPSEDCREYCPGSINFENPFDITNYLSTSQMREVAESIYEKKVNDYVDSILSTRANVGCGNITDQILHRVANNYAEKLGNQYHDEMLKKFKKIIESDIPASGQEDDQCFAKSIQWALENCATDYIKNHPEEIVEIMKDQIAETAKQMVTNNLSYSITQAINKTANEVIGRYFNPDLYKQ